MTVKAFSAFEGWDPPGPGVAAGTVSWETMHTGKWPSESLMEKTFGVTFGGMPVTIDIEEDADHSRWVPTVRVRLTIENVDSAEAVSLLREYLGKQCRVTIGPGRGVEVLTGTVKVDDRPLKEELLRASEGMEGFSKSAASASKAVEEFAVVLGSRNDERVDVIRVNEWCTVQL